MAAVGRVPSVPAPRAARRVLRNAEQLGDQVVVPRHVALAAYQVLQALELLEGLAKDGLATALADVLHADRTFDRGMTPPCPGCGLDVHLGIPHGAACPTEEAAHIRVAPTPRIIGS